MSTPNRNLKERAYRELKEFLIITAYLWVVFGLFLLYRSVILNDEHISNLAKGFALLNALALAKIMLIARAMHLGEWADDAPLIYPTLLKAALFSIVLAVFKIVEETAIGLYHHQTFKQSIADLAGGTLKGILTLTLLLFVMLIPFFGFSELQRILGEGKLAQVFFHQRPVGNQPGHS